MIIMIVEITMMMKIIMKNVMRMKMMIMNNDDLNILTIISFFKPIFIIAGFSTLTKKEKISSIRQYSFL